MKRGLISLLACVLALAVRGEVAFFVQDLRNGQVLASENAGVPLIPASVMKVVTAGSLLSLGDPQERFATPVVASGPIDDGVLNGNLSVLCSGDPTVASRHFPETLGFADSVALAVKNAGIKEIKGKIIINQQSFPPMEPPLKGWTQQDLVSWYGAQWRAACYKENPVKADPAMLMRNDIEHALTRHGIRVEGKTISDTRGSELLYTYFSPTFEEILRSLLFRSDNMMAQGMFRAIAPGGNSRRAISEEMAVWSQAGLPLEGVRIDDGSGLSRDNRLTAQFLAGVLRENASPFFASLLPRAGHEGSVKRVYLPDSLHAVLKSGTMAAVKSYAGYRLDSLGSPTHVIVFMANKTANPKQIFYNKVAEAFKPRS